MALRSIASVATKISNDLRGFCTRRDISAEERGDSGLGGRGGGADALTDEEPDLQALRSITGASWQVCDDLHKSQTQGWPPPLDAPSRASHYDDPVLARARHIAAMTHHLCENISATELKLGSSEHDADVSSLQEISLVTRRVFDDMAALQEQDWAISVLGAMPARDEADIHRHRDKTTQERGVSFGEDSCSESDKADGWVTDGAHRGDHGDDNLDIFQACQPSEDGRKTLGGTVVDAELQELVKRLAKGEDDDGFTESDIARLRAAFCRFKVPDSADLHTDDLNGLLEYLGHVMTREEEVRPLVKEVTVYDYMDFDEFLSFMAKYVTYERKGYRQVFEAYDEDESGEIDTTELRGICAQLGFVPQKAMVGEVLAVVDEDRNGTLNFEEFVAFLTVYRHNEGFTRHEVAELRRQFERVATGSDAAGRVMPGDSLCDTLVHVFGLQVVDVAKKFEQQLLSGQGVGKSSLGGVGNGEIEHLHFPEFLIFARRTREGELTKMKAAYPGMSAAGESTPKGAFKNCMTSCGQGTKAEFQELDVDGSGGISELELRKILQDMHYTPLRQNIHEVFAEVSDAPLQSPNGSGSDRELDFHEFFGFLQLWRQRDGFLKADVKHMQAVFERFDTDGSGEISALELSDLLRHLGYRATLDEIHNYLQEVDASGNNLLDFREFLHLMRLHREQELTKTRKVFTELGHDHGETMPRNRLNQALEELGHEPPDFLLGLKVGTDMDFDAFVMITDSCREGLIKKQRKKAGFADAEIDSFMEQFNIFDKDRSGEIDPMELQRLLREFSWEPKSKEEQAELVKKLEMARNLAREAGASTSKEGSTCITFWEFVQLARILHTQHDRAEEDAMTKLMSELNFSQQEVDEFRKIFRGQTHTGEEYHSPRHKKEHAAAHTSDGIPRDQVRRLVRQLFGVSITPENKGQLDEKLDEWSENNTMSFTGFLRLMKWVVDTDFIGTGGAHAAPKK